MMDLRYWTTSKGYRLMKSGASLFGQDKDSVIWQADPAPSAGH